jgi:hypothetical protein
MSCTVATFWEVCILNSNTIGLLFGIIIDLLLLGIILVIMGYCVWGVCMVYKEILSKRD